MAKLAIKKIRLDGGTQSGARIDPLTVDEYAADMKRGDTFPPVDVFFDGVNIWLAEGFHRLAARVQIGHVEIDAVQHQGTQTDAILFAAGANRKNGLRRTNEDKRQSVLLLMKLEHCRGWSARRIADACGVSNRFVSNMENEAAVNGSQMERQAERNGTTYTINTAGLRGGDGEVIKKARDLIRDTPLADDREFVRKLGLVEKGQQIAVASLIVAGEVRTIAQAKRRIERLAKADQWKDAAAGVELSEADCTIHTGDCRDVLADVPDRSIDLVFTEPPYGIGENYAGFDDNLTRDEMLELLKGFASHLPRILKPTGSAFVMMSSRYAVDLANVLDAAGLYRQAMIVWPESFGTYNPRFFSDCYRVIFHYTRDAEEFTFNHTDTRAFIPSWRNENDDGRQDEDGKLPGNVWGVWTDTELARLVGNASERVPDARAVNQLPAKLVERVVLLASNVGDVVLDPFHGTGTTARACIPLKRQYIGIEIDPAQAKASRRWIKAALANSAATSTKEPTPCVLI